MKRHNIYIIMIGVLVTGCSKTQIPITKESIINQKYSKINKTSIDQICDATYKKIMKYNKLCENKEKTTKINEIANKLISSINDCPIKEWEVIVLKRDDINASCLANGKIFVNEGIFKAAKTDDQIASILAHEISHAILEHGQAKIARANSSNGLAITASLIAGVFNPALIIPYLIIHEGIRQPIFKHYNQNEERDADEMSLKLMSSAGYNIDDSVKLWQNIKSINTHKANKTSSTHLSYNQRIKELKLMVLKEKERVKRIKHPKHI